MVSLNIEGMIEDLGGAALRAFIGLAEAWGLTDQEQMKLLGLSDEPALSRLMSGDRSAMSRLTIERISCLLGIFKAINILLPNQDRADAWLRSPNSAPPFAGRSALDLMTDGSVEDLYVARRHLDAQSS